MKIKIGFKGLTKRWVYTVLSGVLGILLIFEIIVIIFAFDSYKQSVKTYLETELNTVTTFFSSYASMNTESFEAGAQAYAERFTERDRMEIQFLNRKGKVIMSTSGFPSSDTIANDDFNSVITSDSRIVDTVTKLSSGENVMTCLSVLKSSENKNIVVGAVRIVTSLRETYRSIHTISLTLILVGLLMFIFVFVSGLYFMRSILTPVRSLGFFAKQIASGDFDSRIEISKSSKKDEIGQLCETINYMAGELASTEHMKNEFISSVSHELRTPLTAIKGWGETVLFAGDDREITKKGLEVIISEAERLSIIVEDLLDFSRMQNGKLSFRMNQCDIIAELSEAVLTLTDSARRANVELFYTEPEDISPINGDGERLRQLFINIIGNSIKYTPSGGSVDITAKQTGNELVVIISDTGIGISEEDLPKIKEKFYKGKHAEHGSGIGLAVADEIIKGHGGKMEILSTENVGTTVAISLPVENNT